nr:uncharacterized protein LOC127304407 isoform X1 [Lolium perenne]
MAVLPRADLLYGFAGTSVAATATGRCAARDRAGDVASRRRTEPISQTEGVSWRGLEAPRTPPPYAPTSGVARAVVCLAGRPYARLLCIIVRESFEDTFRTQNPGHWVCYVSAAYTETSCVIMMVGVWTYECCMLVASSGIHIYCISG